MLGHKFVLVAGLTAFVPAAGMAAETLSVRLDSIYTNESELFAISEGEALLRFSGSGSMEALEGDTSNLAGATGKCFGVGRMKGGQMAGEGACSYTDTDGDIWQVSWVTSPDSVGSAGQWSLIGGTGKWAGAVGGGSFVDEVSADQMNGVTHITGVIERQ